MLFRHVSWDTNMMNLKVAIYAAFYIYDIKFVSKHNDKNMAVGEELATSTEESIECRWVSKENALDLITLPAIRMRYEAYLNFNGSVNYIEYVTAQTSECNVKLQRNV